MPQEVPCKKLRYKDFRPRFNEEDYQQIVTKARRRNIPKNLFLHNMVKCFLMLPEHEQIELLQQFEVEDEE